MSPRVGKHGKRGKWKHYPLTSSYPRFLSLNIIVLQNDIKRSFHPLLTLTLFFLPVCSLNQEDVRSQNSLIFFGLRVRDGQSEETIGNKNERKKRKLFSLNENAFPFLQR